MLLFALTLTHAKTGFLLAPGYILLLKKAPGSNPGTDIVSANNVTGNKKRADKYKMEEKYLINNMLYTKKRMTNFLLY